MIYMNKYFTEPFKMWTESTNMFKNNADVSGYMQTFQKNLEAFAQAGKVNAENTQAFLRRNTEIMQKSAKEACEAAQDLCKKCNDPSEFTSKQQAYMKHAMKSALENSREYMDMLSKSSMEVFDILSKSFYNNVQEVSTATANAVHNAKNHVHNAADHVHNATDHVHTNNKKKA